MKNADKRLHNIIPLGNNWASMPIGAMSRIATYIELLPNRPPKHTVQLLTLICEMIQRQNLYGREEEQIGIEVSVRQLAKVLTPPQAIRAVCPKTVLNALNWLVENEWIFKDTGHSKSQRTVITINLEKIKEYGQPVDTPILLNYDNQQQEWENILSQLGM